LPRHFRAKTVNRIIDANINRAKEGLRVCEEITRFILESHSLTAELKGVRHKIDTLLKALPASRYLVRERSSLSDVGRDIYAGELKRKSCRDIFFANIQRVKESIRVLEEFTKLTNIRTAVAFKRLRYTLYEIEKKIIGRLSSSSCRR